MKIYYLIILLISVTSGSWAHSIELLPDENGDQNFLMLPTKSIFQDAYEFSVLTNFAVPTKNNEKSSVSDYFMSCVTHRIGYLNWRTYTKVWAKGKLISHESTKHFEQTNNSPKNIQLFNLICNRTHKELT